MFWSKKNEEKKCRESLQKKREDTPLAINVDNLVIHYETSEETVHAVNGINLQMPQKTTLGLVGETGAGKTTAMLALMNMVPNPPGVIKSGLVQVNGLNMQALTPRELQYVRGGEIAMIFQDPMTSLNPVMTVGEQIAESVLLHEDVTPAEADQMAKNMLETVGIDPKRSGEYPHQFSGGMRQRVSIAIALACHPNILIADEPTSALDVTIQAQILRMMKELKNKYGSSMILITHDLGVVANQCDYVAVMYAGRIVEYGALEDVFNHTKHPYTEGLFNSLPNIHNRVEQLVPIEGMMPDPSNLPVGCSFADRCAYATPACFEVPVEKYTFDNSHQVECTAYRDAQFKIRREV